MPVFRVAGHAGLGADHGHDEDGHNGTHRLVDVGVAKGEHDDHDSGDGQQNLDHGVAKGLLEFRPESRRFRVRDGVAAVGSAGLFHFLVVQTVKVHGMFFSFLCAWRKRKRLPFLFLRVIAYW